MVIYFIKDNWIVVLYNNELNILLVLVEKLVIGFVVM